MRELISKSFSTFIAPPLFFGLLEEQIGLPVKEEFFEVGAIELDDESAFSVSDCAASQIVEDEILVPGFDTFSSLPASRLAVDQVPEDAKICAASGCHFQAPALW